MTLEANVNVFAYGSNLHLNRIAHRAPSATPVGIGYVNGRRLEFRKRSLDGSAKADARHTGKASDRIWGVIYRVTMRDKDSLDCYESLGVGYDEIYVDVQIAATQTLSASIYVARSEMIDDSIPPYSWYVDFVRCGALQHALPFCYVREHVVVRSVADPDQDRHNSNRRILNGDPTHE